METRYKKEFKILSSDFTIRYTGKIGFKLLTEYLIRGGTIKSLTLNTWRTYPIDQTTLQAFVKALIERKIEPFTMEVERTELQKLIKLDRDGTDRLLSLVGDLRLTKSINGDEYNIVPMLMGKSNIKRLA